MKTMTQNRETTNKMNNKAAMFQHLRAENSPSGNPQRCYVLMAKDGRIVDVIDEGYQGLPRELRDILELPSVNISRSEYHNYIRIGKEKQGAH
jgi:hypothetical protein